MGFSDVDVNERSISHRLALHLQHYFGNEWDVDCEYNRNLEMIKRLPQERLDGDVSWNDTDAKTIYPDIIVHRLGNNRYNLLVIELKKNNGTSSSTDLAKLDALRARSDDQLDFPTSPREMYYRYTLFLRLACATIAPAPSKRSGRLGAKKGSKPEQSDNVTNCRAEPKQAIVSCKPAAHAWV